MEVFVILFSDRRCCKNFSTRRKALANTLNASSSIVLSDGVLNIDFELKMAEKSVDLQRKEGYNILILTYNGNMG